jgi:hypothetical protein
MPALAFQNNSLGVSPEVFAPYWNQFQFAGQPNGVAMMGIATDCAVVYQLTSAQLLALNSTAVQLVAAPVTAGLPSYLVPPRGFLYVPTQLSLEYIYGTTAYTIGGTSPVIQIEYTGKAGNLISLTPTGLVDQTVNMVSSVATVLITPTALTNAANLGLEVKLGGTTPTLTLGNGTVNLYLVYNTYALL